jgi:trimethylamine--corrinoid protein Co-methyltransferase
VAAAREAERTPRLSAIRYGITPVTAVSEAQLDRIHAASMAILRDIGIEFRDETALQQWRATGARVEGSRVHLTEAMVMDLIAKAPARFTIHGRNPAHVAEIGPDTMTFATMQGAPCVRDLDGIRRASTLEDLRNFNRLTQSLPGFHIGGGFTCEPTDIAVPWRHLEMVRSALLDTDLPFFGLATGQQRSEDCIAMARLVHGAFMDDHAVMAAHISGNSPLVWDATMLEGLRVYAEAGQVVLLSPFVLGAANTPADVAATVAQLNAEALACLAYAQLVRAGTRMIYGQYSVSVSMKSGAPMSGMPEVTLMNVIVGQLARRYGLPWRTTAAQASSKLFDAQSGYESATAMMSGATAGANLMLHAGGWDEAGLVCCMGKFVADAEQNLLIAKYAQGVDFDHFDEALEAVSRIGPGGHYLGDAFTLKHFREAFIAPELLDYLSHEQWKAKGEKPMDQRCREKAAEILAEYEPPQIDPALKAAVDSYVARRQSEISPNIA